MQDPQTGGSRIPKARLLGSTCSAEHEGLLGLEVCLMPILPLTKTAPAGKTEIRGLGASDVQARSNNLLL